MSQKSRNKNQHDNKKLDITLMTLLANEATKDSRKLLKKYGRPDAGGFIDLEDKLTKLYFEASDKVQLEKELAEIHPHKNWLTKVLSPVIEVKEETKIIEVKPEEKSSFSAEDCKCRKSCACGSSSFEGTREITLKDKPMESPLGLICLVAVVGITFYALKTMK